MKVKLTPWVPRMLTQDSACFKASQQRRLLMTLMEFESRTAGSQKIVGEGRSDSATLLSGFNSKQTHNGLQNVV